MKSLVSVILITLCMPLHAPSQGTFIFFIFYNPGAPTHLGSINGPLAGPGTWGQALVGLAPNSLAPLGVALDHRANGIVHPELLAVPLADVGTSVYVRMAAWDGIVWGTSFAGVPANQFGYTDTVTVLLVSLVNPQLSPLFTQPAIVPPVPEPSTLWFAVLGSVALWRVRIGGHRR